MLQDIRFGLRTLAKSPAFTLTAIFSLAIGIGATSGMFSLADALLLRPLPVPDPGRVVSVSTVTPGNPYGAVSWRDYIDLREQSRSFDGLAGYQLKSFGFVPRPGAVARMKYGFLVSGNFFQAMGVQPELGRGFRREEEGVPGRNAVAVLSHDLWEKEFASDRSAIGRGIRLSGIDFTVVGVAPERFTGMDPFVRPALYVPATTGPRVSGNPDNSYLEQRDQRWLNVKGRLKPGVNIAQAQAELAGIARNLEAAYPATNRSTHLTVMTEVQRRVELSPPDATLVSMLMLLAVLLLLVACANVANLLLGRSRSRVREIAIRLAVGAGRGRLVRQLLTESLLIAAAGGLLSLVVAWNAVTFMQQIQVPGDLPILLAFSLDGRALLFATAVSLLSVLVFGLAPALEGSRTDLVPALKASASNAPGRRLWGRNVLVVSQVAITLVLLTVATMLYRGFQRYLAQGPGFRTSGLLLMTFDPSLRQATKAQTHQFYRQVRDRVLSVPGVKSAALAATLPMSPYGYRIALVPEGYQLPRGSETVNLLSDTVDDRYFGTLGIKIARGRGFTETDTQESPRVAVVNEEMARRYWPGQDAIGKRFRLGDRNGDWVQVVGVVPTGKYVWIAEAPTPYVYLPFSQNPRSYMTLVTESRGDPAALAAPLREMVRQIDADEPISEVRTMQDFYYQRAVKTASMVIQTVGSMGVEGLVLAMVGLYGLVAWSVACRTREIAIRMAVGAARGSVLRLVLREGLVLAGVGIVVGLVLAAAAGRLILAGYYTTRVDLLSYFLVPPVLLAVTLVASYVPARRAAQVDPMTALRFE